MAYRRPDRDGADDLAGLWQDDDLERWTNDCIMCDGRGLVRDRVDGEESECWHCAGTGVR